MQSFDLRSQGRKHASGLERRLHGPRHPSVVSTRLALVALRLPESPSPHPSGCDPDEACAHDASCFTPPLKEARHNSRTVSLDLSGTPRSHRGCVRSFELVRVTLVRFHSRAGTAGMMRPTDFCTPKTPDSSTRASSLPGAAATRPTPFDVVRPTALVPRLAPRARSRDVASRAAPPSEDEEPGTERLGATRCKRDRGGPRFTTRSPL